MKFCTACGTKLEDNAAFCSNCGLKQGVSQQEQSPAVEEKLQQETVFGAITGAVNRLTSGKKEAVRPPMRKLFGQILKSHSQQEAETIFACGTPGTTPQTDLCGGYMAPALAVEPCPGGTWTGVSDADAVL